MSTSIKRPQFAEFFAQNVDWLSARGAGAGDIKRDIPSVPKLLSLNLLDPKAKQRALYAYIWASMALPPSVNFGWVICRIMLYQGDTPVLRLPLNFTNGMFSSVGQQPAAPVNPVQRELGSLIIAPMCGGEVQSMGTIGLSLFNPVSADNDYWEGMTGLLDEPTTPVPLQPLPINVDCTRIDVDYIAHGQQTINIKLFRVVLVVKEF
jgi:hypothetical protein